tara:strand:- start:3589 stop:3846 length:258 start_codon:yes stop_codon:yes gene_type:complete
MSNKPLTPEEAVKWALDTAKGHGMHTQPNTLSSIWDEWAKVKDGGARLPKPSVPQNQPEEDDSSEESSGKSTSSSKKFKGFTTGN